jgi:hypothetical protein
MITPRSPIPAILILALAVSLAGCAERGADVAASDAEPDLPIKVEVEGRVVHVLYEGTPMGNITVAEGFEFFDKLHESRDETRQIVTIMSNGGESALGFDVIQQPRETEPCEDSSDLVDCGMMDVQGYNLPYRIEYDGRQLMIVLFAIRTVKHYNTWLRIGYGEPAPPLLVWPDSGDLPDENKDYLRDMADRMKASFHIDETMLYRIAGPGKEHI